MADESICAIVMEQHITQYHTEKERRLVWYDVVPFDDRKRFLQDEMEYVSSEMTMFYKLEDGEDKEVVRKIILNKREIFLKRYMNGEIQLKELMNTESPYDKFLKWVKVKHGYMES